MEGCRCHAMAKLERNRQWVKIKSPLTRTSGLQA
nr:MAG TPA: hypothetical protein [Caudoviricetes sp.]